MFTLRYNLNCSYETKYATVAGIAKTRVGLKPLHKDIIPSVLLIFNKAS